MDTPYGLVGGGLPYGAGTNTIIETTTVKTGVESFGV